jgi:hypothetical protein
MYIYIHIYRHIRDRRLAAGVIRRNKLRAHLAKIKVQRDLEKESAAAEALTAAAAAKGGNPFICVYL